MITLAASPTEIHSFHRILRRGLFKALCGVECAAAAASAIYPFRVGGLHSSHYGIAYASQMFPDVLLLGGRQSGWASLLPEHGMGAWIQSGLPQLSRLQRADRSSTARITVSVSVRPLFATNIAEALY